MKRSIDFCALEGGTGFSDRKGMSMLRLLEYARAYTRYRGEVEYHITGMVFYPQNISLLVEIQRLSTGTRVNISIMTIDKGHPGVAKLHPTMYMYVPSTCKSRELFS
jgi:hypothetical protein